jgi:hypothetical protein
MNVPSRLVAFVAGLAVILGLAFFVGGLAQPDTDVERRDRSPGNGHDDHGLGEKGRPGHGHGRAHDKGDADGYRLELDSRRLPAGTARELRFRLVGPDGRPVTSYEERHERDLHLVLVSTQDLRDYQHVHPTLADDGTWSVDVDLVPGRHRVYADTQPSGAEPVVVEASLRATGGRPVRRPLPAPVDRVSVAGYDVGLVVADGTVTFRVTRDGEPVTDLEPYLGAYGHLVVIRRAGMGYLHANPEEGEAGPEVAFEVEFGKPGRHALYFEFQHDGRVRTAIFTVDASRSARHGH